MLYRLLPVILVLFCIGCYKPGSESYPLGHEKNPIVMAFVPSTEAEKVISSGEELAELLSEQTGLSFKAAMATSYVGIVESMAQQTTHIGWLPPMAYVYAHQRNGDDVLLKVVRNGQSTYKGQIVVMADSGIESLDDLRGRTIAYTDPASSSGYLFPTALLVEAGIDPEEDVDLFPAGSHDAAVLALVKGTTEAAFCYDDARTKLENAGFPDIKSETRILAYTADIPADNVTVIAGLNPDMRQKVADGLKALVQTDSGAQVLMDLYEIEDLVDARDTDYNDLREVAQMMGLDIEAEVRKDQ